MKWQQLLSSQRLGLEDYRQERRDDRTAFQRDYDRLIFSAPFRRMQNKTQVFPLPGSVFVHNRLTHSLEVSSVGRSLGYDVSRLLIERHPELSATNMVELGTIVSTACLAHDMGNPPFGHSGEKAIGTCFSEGSLQWLRDFQCQSTGCRLSEQEWADLTHFEGNANAFRLLTHHFVGRRKGGFVMTYATLASIVKYPYPSTLAGGHQKFGFFKDEQAYYEHIADQLGIGCTKHTNGEKQYARYPLVYLVEAADDICYEIMDIEDAHKLKILSDEETMQLMTAFFDEERLVSIRNVLGMLGDVNEQIVYLRSCVIGKLVQECVRVFVEHEEEILSGTFQGTLIKNIEPVARAAYQACSRTAVTRIYHCKDVLDVELAGFRIITHLTNLMVEAVCHPERAYSQLLLGRVSSQYDIKAKSLYGRVMAVLDYISGMTDVYALDLYQKINGINIPTI